MMNGLGTVNVELTSRCNKKCWMCGRRKLEREHPELCNWGDMPKDMVEELSQQIPKGIVVQFHNNGEPLLFPDLGWALSLFSNNIRCLNTNAKLLLERFDEIVGLLDTITISVIQNDEEGDEQYSTVDSFIRRKGIRKPLVVCRLLGKVDNPERWERMPGIIARRILHDPDGSRNYQRRVTIPEIGVCLDLLTHMAISRIGDVSVCVRFDPEKHGVLGNIKDFTLEQIWNGQRRKHFIQTHLEGHRDFLHLCGKCDYWGIPRGD